MPAPLESNPGGSRCVSSLRIYPEGVRFPSPGVASLRAHPGERRRNRRGVGFPGWRPQSRADPGLGNTTPSGYRTKTGSALPRAVPAYNERMTDTPTNSYDDVPYE